MKTHFGIGLLILALAHHAASAERISGVVFGVDGTEIEILLPTGKTPDVGTPVELFAAGEGGKKQSIGIWSITRTEINMAYARPLETSAKPKLGQTALIGKAEPKPAPPPTKPPVKKDAPPVKPPSVPATKQPVPVPKPAVVPPAPKKKVEPPKKVSSETTVSLSAEDRKLVDDLVSMDAGRIRNAARKLYDKQCQNPAVMDKAAEVLQAQFNQAPEDSLHVDAMAWLCKALWVSGDAKYLPVMREAETSAVSLKLRKYALKYRSSLERKTR